MTEKQMLSDLKQGKVSALNAIIGRYTPYVYAVASHILAGKLPPEDAEEVVADSFTALWYAKDRVKPGNLKSYLAAIARNKAVSRLRSLQLWEPLEDDVPITQCQQPEAQALAAELETLARQAVDSLPPPEDEIFTRHYFLFQTAEKIGTDMGIPPATVRTKLKRGREKLREYLEERGYRYENTLE